MTKVLMTLLFSVYLLQAEGQQAFSAKRLAATQIPQKVSYTGKIKEAWQWQDKAGKNLLILSEVGEHPSGTDEDAKSAALAAYHYVQTDTGYRLLWRIMDYIKECTFDVTCSFFKDVVSITDLDKDGTAETTVAYKLSCRSDVSPDYMKVILHEGAIKYALRGLMCDPGNGEHQEGCASGEINLSKLSKPGEDWEQMLQSFGRYETDKDFEKAPASFLAFARSQWLKYVKSFE